MSINRSRLNLGLFFVALGAVPLAVQVGLIDRTVTGQVVSLWPVILIALGLGLMLRFGPAHLAGGLIVAITIGLIGGALIAGGGRGFAGTCSGAPTASEPSLSLNGALTDGARVRLEVSCVDLTINRQQSADWAVQAQQGGGQPPVIEQNGNVLELRTPETAFVPSPKRAWNVTLPNVPIGSVSLTTNAATSNINLGGGSLGSIGSTFNASDGRLDLSGADLSNGSIGMTLNASSATMVLPASGARDAGITVNASSLTLCVAPQAAMRIDYSNTLSSDNFAAAGLERVGDAWQTPAYAAVTGAIELNVSANVSSINLDRSGVCR